MILMACCASSGLQFSSAVHIYWGCRAVSAQSFDWEEHFSHEGQFASFIFRKTQFPGSGNFQIVISRLMEINNILRFGNFYSECNSFFANYNYLFNIYFCKYNLSKIIIERICYRILLFCFIYYHQLEKSWSKWILNVIIDTCLQIL